MSLRQPPKTVAARFRRAERATLQGLKGEGRSREQLQAHVRKIKEIHRKLIVPKKP